MTKKNVMWMLALLIIASPMIFAQAVPADTSAIAQAHAQWTSISAGFSMAIASGLCGLAQATDVAAAPAALRAGPGPGPAPAAAEGRARNPGAAAAIRFALLLGLVLIESLALYT